MAAFDAQGALHLSYRVRGRALLLPERQTPVAIDGLWQHTCCEAFVAAVDGAGYREFNFSPSSCWAVYDFRDYRARDEAFRPLATPQIEVQPEPEGFRLDAFVPPELLPAGLDFDLGLSVVLEARDGSKTYWALRHAAAQPDFHLRQSFALALALRTEKP